MDIQLIPVAPEKRSLLNDMLIDYEKELINEARSYKYLDTYFTDKERYPYFIMMNNQVVGFVLVNAYTTVAKNAKSIGEFYVVKEHRAKGIGTEAAKEAFSLFPGKWEVRELTENIQGQVFWRKVIQEYTHNNYEEVVLDTKEWKGPVQTFNTDRYSF